MSGQKMICSGKQLNTGDGWLEKSIGEVRETFLRRTLGKLIGFAQAGLKTGSKVMLLGKKYDPAQEEGYRQPGFFTSPHLQSCNITLQ